MKVQRTFWDVTDMFIILIVGMVSWGHSCIKFIDLLNM